MVAITISIYYYRDVLCELEPIGPREDLKPGQSASFREDWWLLSYKYPKRIKKADLKAVTEFVRQKAK
jgi:hypothetical protein